MKRRRLLPGASSGLTRAAAGPRFDKRDKAPSAKAGVKAASGTHGHGWKRDRTKLPPVRLGNRTGAFMSG
jgi:hypothetical protein